MNYIIVIFVLLILVLVYFGHKRYKKNASDVYYKIIRVLKSTDFHFEILDLINRERKLKGLKPLIMDFECKRMAEQRCDEIIEDFSHDGFDTEIGHLMKLGADGVGENLAVGYNSAISVLEAWKRSEGHEKNMLNPSYDAIGIGIKMNEKGTNYICTIFINENNIN